MDNLADLLDELGLVSDKMVEQITGTTETTRLNWQKRRKFATRIRLGQSYYYTKSSLLAEISRLSEEQTTEEPADNCLAFPTS